MRLKRVRIFGFKTFADKVEINLDADLMAIVGPNGCGKSNIVDAILWGLGEPNARNLRAATGIDVIFNGSEKRKPLGYAEVTLVFDNDSGMLPLPASEVAISRRLTRAGDSHYSINKRTCRLKDIFDLLADSGLGRSGFAIVGQRDIDQALKAGAEERRAWIDEAAGVQRFRSQRMESEKRLLEAEAHLERLTTLRDDLDYQREPLREEAELAQKYLRVRDQLQELEFGMLAQELRKCESDISDQNRRIDAALEGIENSEDSQAKLKAEQGKIGEEISEAERKLDALRELRQAAITAMERARAASAMAEQKLTSLADLEEALKSEAGQADQLRAEAFQAIEQAQEDRQRTEQRWKELESTLGTSRERLEQLQQGFHAIEQELARAQKANHERSQISLEQHHAQQRLNHLEEEWKGVEQDVAPIQEAISESQAEVALLDHKLSQAREAIQAHEAEQSQYAVKREQEERALRESLATAAGWEGRVAGLESTLASMEGLGQGAAAVLKLVQSGDLDNVYVPVATAIHVDQEYALAIETALGAAMHDLIVPRARDAQSAIEILKARQLGRATFQPLDGLRVHNTLDHSVWSSKPGILGVANRLVSCEPEHQLAIDLLLGRILIAETLEDARKYRSTQGWSRILTLDGEVLTSAGSMTGGKNQRHGPGIVQRQAELDALKAKLNALHSEIASKKEALERSQEGLQGAKERSGELKQAESIAVRELQESQGLLRKLTSELESLHRDRSKLEREREKIQEILNRPIPEAADELDLQSRRDVLLGEKAEAQSEERHATQVRREAREELERAEARLKDAQRRLDALENKGENRQQRLERIETDRAKLTEEVQFQQEESADAKQRVEGLEIELSEVQAVRQSLLEQNLELDRKHRKASEEETAFSSALKIAELEKARTESKKAQVAQRLVEEYGKSPEEVSDQMVGVELPPDAVGLVQQLRRELKSLGLPNLGAIEAYERVQEKWHELTVQIEDIESSRMEIWEATREIDRMTEDKFVAGFEKISKCFTEAFGRIFGGGEASMTLSSPEQPLRSGVDIEVALPGKRRQRLELLSGGERSLCACAFLFALLMVKPSPLVILDEVDAPLDGRNVERFLDELKRLTPYSQFLLITHNPVTIEAAPLWIGVTMSEPGVSSLIPYRAPEERALIEEVIPEAYLSQPS